MLACLLFPSLVAVGKTDLLASRAAQIPEILFFRIPARYYLGNVRIQIFIRVSYCTFCNSSRNRYIYNHKQFFKSPSSNITSTLLYRVEHVFTSKRLLLIGELSNNVNYCCSNRYRAPPANFGSKNVFFYLTIATLKPLQVYCRRVITHGTSRDSNIELFKWWLLPYIELFWLLDSFLSSLHGLVVHANIGTETPL